MNVVLLVWNKNMENIIKCKYCAFTIPRFRGRGVFQGKKLWVHTIYEHEKEFLEAIGFAGTLIEYLQYLDLREEETE